VKYKSVGANRNRLGSEDIALVTGHNTGNDTRTPNNGNSNNFFTKNNETSKASNSVAFFGAPSFEKYENIRLTQTKIETKQGSQTFKVDSPSKKSCSFANSGTLNKVVNLQPVEEEDKNESSDQDFSIEFDRRRHQPFGDDYRSSFKKSSYKMTSVKKINLPSPEDISEERLHEGPIIRNSVYNFNNKNSKEIFDRITRRSNIKTSLNRAI